MKNIIFYARLVKILAYVFMPIILINLFIKWLSPEMLFSDSFIAGFLYGCQSVDFIITTMPLLHRLMAMVIESISVSLLFMILAQVIAIMNHIQQHEIFSTSIVTQFGKISTFAFWLALYMPLSRSILSVITTLHNEPGHRILAASFGTTDLLNIFIFGFFMIITLLMQQGTSLQNEHNLTV